MCVPAGFDVYLRRVTAGEALEVTEHGRTVAVLAPLPESTPLAGLIAAGQLRPGQGDRCRLRSPVVADAMSMSAALAEQRAGDR